MRALCVAILVPGLLTVPLAADTHEVIKTTVAGREMVSAWYVQGKNTRTEDLSPQRPGPSVTIQNSERNMMYALDPQSREYVEYRPPSADLILSFADWIARPPRTQESGKVVNIYYETIDTGERREFFGRTAKHLLFRERRVADPGACTPSYELEKDGWYLSRAELGPTKRAYFIASIGSPAMCHDTIVVHGDPSPPGVAVLETNGSITREILELSNDPLDRSLFEVPADFRKVDSFPGYPTMTWSDRLQMDWAQLQRAFESWFQ